MVFPWFSHEIPHKNPVILGPTAPENGCRDPTPRSRRGLGGSSGIMDAEGAAGAFGQGEEILMGKP